MTETRFYVAGAAAGARACLAEDAAHHALDVLRIRVGAQVTVFDGSGHEYRAVIEEATRKRFSVHILGPVPARPESLLRLVLALPPLRGDRMELVIQKVVELGVTEIWPVVTARTDAAGRPALKGARGERWERVAIGAAEQCGRAVVPIVRSAVALDTLFQSPFSGQRLVFTESASALPLTVPPRAASVLALVGPPGGFESSEAERLADGGFTAVRLGPRRLRSETAAIAAVTALQLLWGDLA